MVKKITLAIVIVFVLFAAWQVSLMVRMTNIFKATVVENVDLLDVKDGTYEGAFKAILVTADTKVTVEESRITDIKLLKHDHGPKHSGEAVVGQILEAQSLDVDGVSGATGSAIAIRKSVEQALKKGLGKKAEQAASEAEAMEESAEAEEGEAPGEEAGN